MRRKQQTHRKDQPFNLHGLADAFGLESLLIYDEKQIPQLIMRASIYRFRHCTYFQVQADEVLVEQIRSLMKRRACDEALNLLKERAQIINVPEEFLDSWTLIPDHRLDPFKNYSFRNCA